MVQLIIGAAGAAARARHVAGELAATGCADSVRGGGLATGIDLAGESPAAMTRARVYLCALNRAREGGLKPIFFFS